MARKFSTLVSSRWGPLSKAENRLIQFVSGLTLFPPPPGRPGLSASGSGDDQRVRHELLPWLIVEQSAQLKLRRALEVRDSVFDEVLDLSFCSCEYPIRFVNCEFRKGLELTSAHFCHLEIAGGLVNGLRAASVHVDDDLVLGTLAAADAGLPPPTTIDGGVVLTDGRIGRNLRMRNIAVRDEGGVSLQADRIRVDGNVELQDGFRATGVLRFVGARIEGSFNANDVVLGTQRNGAAAPRQEPAAASGSRQARRDVPWPWHVPTAPARVPLPAEDGPTGEKYVLNLEGARVDGDVYLKSATFHGGVRLVGASVGDAVDLRGATIEGLHGVSLAADRLKTGGTVFLYCTVLHGKAMLQGATVGGNLDMDAVQVQGWNGVAVQANRLHVRGNLKMGDGFAAFGCVDVSYATVDTNWQCRDCTFIAPPDPVRRPWSRAGAQYDDDPGECLAGMGVVVRGTLEMMDGFLSSGIVRLTGISVHQDAILTRASFQSGADRISLRMERADVRGDLSLESSYLDGSVRLSGTRVKGSLRFDGATLAKSLRRVLTPALLDGARLRVGGDVTFIGTMVEFGVSLEGAHIESGLTFKCTNFVKPVRLDARHLRVKGVLAWKPVAVAPDVEVNLADASLGCIEDDGVEGWPGNGGLILDGCEYKTINSDRFGDGPLANEGGAKERLRWLRRQPHPYLPQPYEQLANALRRDGYNNGARKVMMAREAARRREPGMPVRLRALNRLHGAILGYGYRIKWTLVSALVWVALSGVAFDIAYDRGGMHRLKDAVYEAHASDAVLTAHARSAALSAGVDTAASYPRFQPWVYSLDAFLPIVDLRQQEFWIPNRTMPVWEWFHWCHILLGWIVSTLVVVGVTSMVRKDP